MLQQRKHAWVDKKKKTESETGKYGACSGKYISSCTATYKQLVASKMSYADLTAKTFSMTGVTRNSKVSQKTAPSQNQFLPPILAISTDIGMSLHPRQSKQMCADGSLKGLELCKSEITARDQEKENKRNRTLKSISTSTSAQEANQSSQLDPNFWDQKSRTFVDFGDFTPAKMQSMEIYKASPVLTSFGKDGKNERSAFQTPEITSSIVKGNGSQQSWAPSKVSPVGMTAWKSTDTFQVEGKAENKLLSRDSAFGTDTWSETARVDFEQWLEDCELEMGHYSHQRIIDWILEVNAVLFSPTNTYSVTRPLTEQDTSIKIVYEGD